MRRSPHLRALSAIATVSTLVLASCGGGGPSGRPDPSGPNAPGTLSTSFALAPAQPPVETEFTASFNYTIAPTTVLLGSYLAEVRFDPAQVTFIEADPAMASSRLVNAGDAATGLVVVGGAQTSGFRDGVLFKARFRNHAPAVSAATFQLTIREAVDTRLDSLLLN